MQCVRYGVWARPFPVTNADENALIYAAPGSSAPAASTTCGRDIPISLAWNSGWDRGDTRSTFTRPTTLNHRTIHYPTQLWKIPWYNPVTAQCCLIHAHHAFHWSYMSPLISPATSLPFLPFNNMLCRLPVIKIKNIPSSRHSDMILCAV